ncbi:MAG TPA: RluA family pseudouridine synthase, partial [Acidimicrobiales bacterium]|nr:RluA family pseudouridine synthase [Acidimicrobiales bacterium]
VAGLLARYPELAALPGEGAGATERPGIVHRLDKDTSGLLVVARTASSYRSLVGQLKRRSMGRGYLAVVVGHLGAPAGVVDAPIGRSPEDPTVMAVSGAGREARTAYRVLRRASEPLEATVIEATLETGRTHQIRVHLAAIGHPVLGDRRYGGARGAMPLRRPMLHAARLELEHPATGERLVFEAEPPEDLREVLASLS